MHWMTQANLRLPPAASPPLPITSDPEIADVDLGKHAAGRLLGELAVHRETFCRDWSGSEQAMESILDALASIGPEQHHCEQEIHLIDPQESMHGLSLQNGAGRV